MVVEGAAGLIDPIAHVAQISREVANGLLVEWGHRMGPLNRGNTCGENHHALYVLGRPVALASSSGLIREHVGGGLSDLTRANTVELSRLCAGERWACRVMLRLWREVIFPASGKRYAISYQDAVLHTGSTYRLDGWRKHPIESRSGTDSRSGRKGRRKVIWIWERRP